MRTRPRGSAAAHLPSRHRPDPARHQHARHERTGVPGPLQTRAGVRGHPVIIVSTEGKHEDTCAPCAPVQRLRDQAVPPAGPARAHRRVLHRAPVQLHWRTAGARADDRVSVCRSPGGFPLEANERCDRIEECLVGARAPPAAREELLATAKRELHAQRQRRHDGFPRAAAERTDSKTPSPPRATTMHSRASSSPRRIPHPLKLVGVRPQPT
jgi:hypothetical protein